MKHLRSTLVLLKSSQLSHETLRDAIGSLKKVKIQSSSVTIDADKRHTDYFTPTFDNKHRKQLI